MEVEIMAPAAQTDTRESLFRRLYRTTFLPVAKFVSKRGGSFEEARDIFQDALVIYYEKSRAENFNVEATEEAYVVGIAKHLWVKKFKREGDKVSFSEFETRIDIPHEFYQEVSEKKLMAFLERAGQKCMEILTAFYYHRQSLRELMQSFGFSSIRSATVQKYKCLEKVRETIKEKSASYEDFMEGGQAF